MIHNSRAALMQKSFEKVGPDPEKPSNSSRGKGLIMETPYKPGFVDDKDLETVKMAVDKELSDISNAFYETIERTADTVTRIDKIEIDGSTQYGELNAKIETVDKVSKEGDAALAQRITTVSAEFETEIGKNTSLITSESTARAEADKVITQRVDNILGAMEGDLGPLVGQIQTDIRVNADNISANAQRIDTVTASYEQADKTLDAAIKTETTARVDADSALGHRIDTVSADISGVDGKISAAVATETTARVEADAALAGQITTVKAELEGQIGQVQQYAEVNIGAAKDLISKEEADRLAQQAVLDGKITKEEADRLVAQGILEGKITANADAVKLEEAQRLAGEAVLQGKITQEEADRLIAQGILQGNIDATNGKVEAISAKWGVSVDVNGNVAGIELNNGTGGSEFKILANRFYFTDGVSTIPPFAVVGNTVHMSNVNVRGTLYAEDLQGDVGTEWPTITDTLNIQYADRYYGWHQWRVRNNRPYTRHIVFDSGFITGPNVTGSNSYHMRLVHWDTGNVIGGAFYEATPNVTVPIRLVGTLWPNMSGVIEAQVLKYGTGGYVYGSPGSIRMFKETSEIERY